MSRDPLTRMDVDTRWAYHRKLRALQRLYPESWPVYWAAYLALLGEAWAKGSRSLTLEDAWCPAVPCSAEEALAALKAARVVDGSGRIPLASWRKWYEPAAKRIRARSDAARVAAEKRWSKTGVESGEGNTKTGVEVGVSSRGAERENRVTGALGNGTDAMPTHSASNAPRQPRQPTTPPTPGARPRARSTGLTPIRDNGTDDDRADAIARAQAKLDDPKASEDVKVAARFALKQLGAGA